MHVSDISAHFTVARGGRLLKFHAVWNFHSPAADEQCG